LGDPAKDIFFLSPAIATERVDGNSYVVTSITTEKVVAATCSFCGVPLWNQGSKTVARFVHL
jgi:hypothetical protein